MNAELEFEMNGALWQAAARRLWRYFIWRYGRWVMLGLAAAFMVFPRLAGMRGLLAAIVLLVGCAAMLIHAYRRFMRRAGEQAAEMKPSRLSYRITDDGLCAPIAGGEALYPWKQFRLVVRSRDVWLVFYTKTGALFVPARVLEGGAGDFLVQKVRQNGGRVE